MKLLAALIVVLAAGTAAQAGAQQVTVSVPVMQVLEGVTTLPLTAGASRRAQVVVKSNVPWRLAVRISGPAAGAHLRVEGANWTAIEDGMPVVRGGRGVHRISYEVRSGAMSGTLTLVLMAGSEGRP